MAPGYNPIEYIECNRAYCRWHSPGYNEVNCDCDIDDPDGPADYECRETAFVKHYEKDDRMAGNFAVHPGPQSEFLSEVGEISETEWERISFRGRRPVGEMITPKLFCDLNPGSKKSWPSCEPHNNT